MVKTTVYLPADLKERLRSATVLEGRSEADLIRECLDVGLRIRLAPEPTLPLFKGAPTDLAQNADAYLDGFGKP